ncbi:MAG: hypothetical protein HYX54_08730 [Chloroflexi bacterium]|nr:hypothetical protein [Chloroflexota bacterium]
MRTSALPNFLPSTHGLRFVNRWPSGPAFEFRVGYLRLGIGEVADGLCGGMCLAVADRYLANQPVPMTIEAPAPGSPLFREIARRQFDSLGRLGAGPLRFWWAGSRLALGRWTTIRQAAEWRALCRDIEAGRPAMAGLVRSAGINPLGLTGNHQVLAFAHESTPDSGLLRVYDPNHPGSDEVSLRILRDSEAGGPARFRLEQSTGEPLLALLRLPYRRQGA